MSPEPSLTVIIPAYNAAAFIADTVASALAQDGVDIRVIVVDDGSTDATSEIVAGIGDDRITLLSQDNAGPAAARNHGVSAATTDFVGLLDADDTLEQGWARAVCEALSAGACIAVTDAYLFNDGGREPHTYYQQTEFASGDQQVAILERNFLISTAGVLRSAVTDAGGYREGVDFQGIEDWALWQQILLRGNRAVLVPSVLSGYRRGHQSLSSNSQRMKSRELSLLQGLDEQVRTSSKLKAARSRGRRRLICDLLLSDVVAVSQRAPREGAIRLIRTGAMLHRGDHVKLAAILLLLPGTGKRMMKGFQ